MAQSMTIKTKMAVILATVILCSTLMMGWNAYSTYRSLLSQRQTELASLVDNAISVLAGQQARVDSGELTPAEARTEAAALIESMRYRGNEYFFIIDERAHFVMHPFRPDLNGTDGSGMEDPNGVRLFVEMVDITRAEGSGMVRYSWPRAGETEPAPKMTFVEGFDGWGWIVGTGIYVDDIHAMMRNKLIEAGLTLLAFGGILTAILLGLTRSILAPLSNLGATMNRLADGELEHTIEEAGRKDEIGMMARRVEHFRKGMLERRELEEKSAADQAARLARQERVDGFIREFRETSQSLLQRVSDNVGTLRDASRALQEVTSDTLSQATNAARQSSETSSNVQTVAAASEELSASIEEIMSNVASTAKTVSDTADMTEQTNAKVAALNEAGQRIGTVVSLISDIAEQTNLLALNATIEAARAGEAGKGFAVVASEVKSLANQTSGAISEITSQIEAVQTAATEAARAIDAISAAMATASSTTAAIAAAVEQQGAATSEISRNAQSAADGTQSAANSANHVSGSAETTMQSSGQVGEAADDVASNAEALRKAMEAFLADVAAA